jgi:glucose/mannose transport system substrate-binding protein
LMQWALFNEVDDSDSKLEPLNSLASKNGWLDVFPQPVLDSLSYDGNVYAVPANIHRNNSLFYSISAFEAAGVTPPQSLDELLSTSQQLRDAGYTPLCIGTSHWWTLVLLTFENIFPAVAGGEYYTSYWHGQEDAQSSQINATFDYLLQLWPHFNADANSLDWTQGIDHMFDSENACAMTVMGDWAKGYLENKGWRAGSDFEQMPFPGTAGTFVFTADTFPLPKGAANRTAAIALLETIGSVEGQIAFNVVKGSIPVRTDVDPNEFDATAQRTMADFAGDELIIALSGIMATPEDLGPALVDMLDRSSKEAPLNVLANDYHTFR